LLTTYNAKPDNENLQQRLHFEKMCQNKDILVIGYII